MGKKDKKKLPTPSESSEEEEVQEVVEEKEEANPEDTSDLSDEEEEEVKQPVKKGGKPEEVQVFISGIPYECSE